MTKEEKKAIEHLEFLKDNFNPPNYVWFLKDVEALDIVLSLIYKQQEEIKKKDKVIDLMAERLVEDSSVFNYEHSMTEEKWKEFFYEEAEK